VRKEKVKNPTFRVPGNTGRSASQNFAPGVETKLTTSGESGPPLSTIGDRIFVLREPPGASLQIDFIIIGSMKAATTTLHKWLGAQPEIHMASVKEPSFFSFAENWSQGYGWYEQLFTGAAPGQLLGEASTSYTFPEFGDISANRIAEHHPEVRLIFLVRHPLDRLRSHYRHEVQRGREKRPLSEAVSDPNNEYVRRSCYYSTLRPYMNRFARDQIRVVTTEALIGADSIGWHNILSYLDLPLRTSPGTSYNQTDEKPQFTAGMLRLWESGWYDRLKHLPSPIRKLARGMLTREGTNYEQQLSRSNSIVDSTVVDAIWADVAKLQNWLGSGALWPQDNAQGERHTNSTS